VLLLTSRRLAHDAVQRGAYQKETELAPLIDLVRRDRPKVVVEIGTAAGGTFYAWCRVAAHDAILVSIDLPGGDFGGGYTVEDVVRFRTYGRRRQSLHFLREDSHEESTRAQLQEILGGRPIDFLMIDGDHRYAGVKRDLELYAPLVREYGVVAFHDVLPHPEVPSCEVDRLWREVRGNYEYEEFLDPADDRGFGQWGGIGVLRWESRDLDEFPAKSHTWPG
jgi:predicted O-methyltransferase YrrM